MAEQTETHGAAMWEPRKTTLDETSLDARTSADVGSWRKTTLDQDAEGNGFMIHHLPSGMAADYELLERLGGGAEAAVYRALDRRNEREVAIKLYPHITPTYAFEIGSEAHRWHFPHEHCVDLYERRVEGRIHFEVMELCPEGTLEDYAKGRALRNDEIMQIVAEVAEALHTMNASDHTEHTFRHGDLKPQNILVRSQDPLDLVLTDFGLTLDLGQRNRMTVLGHGTRLYQPPGTGKSGRTADDWWALGIIVAELAWGRHPFDGVPEITRSEEALKDYLIHNPVPTDQIADPRIRHLVRGLLVRRPEDRFGYEQVRQWLDGGTPELPMDAGIVQGAHDPITFQGKHYIDAVQLAEAIRASPRSFEAGQGIMFRDLVAWSAHHPNHGRISNLARRAESLPGRVAAGLLATLLAGDGRLVIDGVDLTTPKGLAKLCEQPEVLDQYLESHILSRCSEVLRDPQRAADEEDPAEEFARLDHAWRTCFDDARDLLSQHVADISQESRHLLLIESWRCAIDDEHSAELRASIQTLKKKHRFLGDVEWFEVLWKDRRNPVMLVAMSAGLPTAKLEADKLRAEHALHEKEEKERRRRNRKQVNALMMRRLFEVFWRSMAPALGYVVWILLSQVFEMAHWSWGSVQLAFQVLVHSVGIPQLWAAGGTVLICIPGARRDGFVASSVLPLHGLAVLVSFATLATSDPALIVSFAPWVGCGLVGIQQLLFLLSPWGRSIMSEHTLTRMNLLLRAETVSAGLGIGCFGIWYLQGVGMYGWMAYSRVLGGQLLFSALILLPVVRTKWLNATTVVLLNLVPVVLGLINWLQLDYVADHLHWPGRDCFRDFAICLPYAPDVPTPEPHAWVLAATVAYAALCAAQRLFRQLQPHE